MSNQFGSSDVTSDDKLWAALGYPIPIIPIIVLLMEDKKNRPFIKFHAIQSLIFNVAQIGIRQLIVSIVFTVLFIVAWTAPIMRL